MPPQESQRAISSLENLRLEFLVRVRPATFPAVAVSDAAVDLDDALAARLLVKPVDVLRDHGVQLAAFFQHRQKPVRECGLDPLHELDEVSRKRKEIARIAVEVGDVKRLLRIVLPGDVEAPRSAKIGNPRRSRDAGSRQRRDMSCSLNHSQNGLVIRVHPASSVRSLQLSSPGASAPARHESCE